ncbi:hypothetical protein QJS10_CPA01g02835 [Acorus calamus]|uniref:Cationic amino acid transporter C-terminal domain-containing protein n=1 Tax=Acorus calamus TaxID=4465 RepID=A0AAV9FNK0_ACOCL|nr:hypothetical protein QJS10_CPA01g02835 [Acorus calamus]
MAPNIISRCLQSLSKTPHRLRKRMLATWTPSQELTQVRERSGADMKRKLEWYDLVSLGVGGMLGVGVFVTTGRVAHKISGPAVFISYIIAGISAFLSSLCYTEFSVGIPVAGGAFSYLRSDPNSWRIEVEGLAEGYNMLDLPAVALIIALTFCLCHSTKESSILNLVMTVFHVLFFGFVIVAGFYNGSAKNLVKPRGLAPFGVRGVLDGAAIVYFSYIGYDSVSTLAEEIKNPSKSLPIGIAGSVLIVSALYCLMALALSVLIPYNEISGSASFSSAFQTIVGWRWASNVVGAGASLGIVASLLVAMLGQARYLCVIGRTRLVPYWFAMVHPSTGTPINATVFLGMCTASIALFTELDIVLEMINIGTLIVFYLVANALMYRRYVQLGHSHPLPVLLFLLLLSLGSLGFAVAWKLGEERWWMLSLFVSASAALTAIFQCRIAGTAGRPPAAAEWWVPFMPWPAAASVFLNVFLMGTLRRRAFQRFGIWSCAVTVFYVAYGVHSTYHAEEEEMVVGMGVDGDANASTQRNAKVEEV